MQKMVLFILSALLLAGCGPENGAQLDRADEKDSRVRKALELLEQKKTEEAVKQFEDALSKKPALARPDLELAMIFQRNKQYARAICHYESYLKKRPGTEKVPLIREWINQSKRALGAEAGGDVSDELVRLTRENNLLRKQLAELQGSGAAPVAPTVTAAPAPAVRPAAATPARTHTVKAGDTLSRIAALVYGDASRWKAIYDANRDQMKNETDLKIGQTLVIPDDGS